MNNIFVSDVTLREAGKSDSLSFKEKIILAETLDRLNVDIIETAPIQKGKADVLYWHTIIPLIKNSILCCPLELNVDSVEKTYDAVKTAKRLRLNVMAPVSTVQMEYMYHKKADKMIDLICETVKAAKEKTEDIEVTLIDAARAEKDFLYSVTKAVIESGATTVTLCDTAGEMFPYEFLKFAKDLYQNVPELRNVNVAAECSDALNMSSACAFSGVYTGLNQIKTAINSESCSDLGAVLQILRTKSEDMELSSGINFAILEKEVEKIRKAFLESDGGLRTNIGNEDMPDISLSENDNISSVTKAVEKLGYDLTEEDMKNVYEEFLKISRNKKIGNRELEAIVASSAMQVEPVYKFKSYVSTSGNVISTSVQVELTKNGEVLKGICMGDGPIHAAFCAIEQITGHKFELDDFQIQAVTHGGDSVGSGVVKLRHNGKLFSGKGISTDIVEASIKAYINALNKICFEEENI